MPDYDPEILMQSKRGPRGDTDVKRWLRSRSDEECFDFIARCIRFRGYAYESRSLDLAKSSIRRPAHALAILRSGLANPDASSIKFWLAFALPKLGPKKVVAELSALLASNPTAVDMALYWLPSLLAPTDEGSRAAFRALRDEAARRGVIRGPDTTCSADGKTLFRDIYRGSGTD